MSKKKQAYILFAMPSMRNMLQLNNGVRKVRNKNEPFYSEIGQLAGIAERTGVGAWTFFKREW